MTFRSSNQKLKKDFEKRRLTVINRQPRPASEICDHCWYQAKCILRTLQGDKPRTCCVYSLFTKGPQKSFTLEETVAWTCEKKCVERQAWQGDPVPHDENYCSNHCPVSKFIQNKKPSEEHEVPTNGLY
jgi:hypothetical protein